ncbi:MAG: insulinase family protein [Cytophagales bacterium]|nr:MAG: insulinase family protein [Cytophagales bacterium]
MIQYQEFYLNNGLRVLLHEDKNSPIAVVNLVYNIGSRDESPEKTGFAHLFEHLMFGGSKHIPSYDQALQKVGGENNAFTSPDLTNYYLTLPIANLETALWLESDRMLSLSFQPEVLEVQRKVVIEEFKQRYLNQPYGDLWLKLRPLAYQEHPYQWATIGKDIAHIENATMDDVKDFFYKYYIPNNAILSVAGNISLSDLEKLVNKWFGDIPMGKPYQRKLAEEPKQEQARHQIVQADVPLEAVYKAYHMGGRNDAHYFSADLASDVLGRSKSARLHQQLVRKRQIFNSISAYVVGSIDPGLFVIGGKLNKGISAEEGDQAIQEVLQDFLQEPIQAEELEKVKNQAEATLVLSEVELLTRAMNLAYFALLDTPDAVNKQGELIQAVTVESLQTTAQTILKPENCSTLYYKSL